MATVKKMMKKSAPKKAMKGITEGPGPKKKKTVMQNLLAKYPGTDTSAAGDTRFQEFNAYAPKKELKRIADTDKAFDKKYGKGKPAKNKMGGTTKKKAMSGAKMTTKYKTGGKMSSKMSKMSKKK